MCFVLVFFIIFIQLYIYFSLFLSSFFLGGGGGRGGVCLIKSFISVGATKTKTQDLVMGAAFLFLSTFISKFCNKMKQLL